MAVVIFHSIKLASFFAFNSMNPSILIIIDLSYKYAYDFFNSCFITAQGGIYKMKKKHIRND